MEFCCLPAGVSHVSIEDRCSLFCRIMKLFMYFTGQFPYLSLLDSSQNQLDTGLKLDNLHPKELKLLQSIQKVESNLLISKSEHISYFLIMIGGLPNSPKRAFLIDLNHFHPKTNLDKTDNVTFREFFESLVQVPFFDNVFKCLTPTRTYIYICTSKDFSSPWFLPRLQFRLPQACRVYVLKIVPDIIGSYTEDHTDVNCHSPKEIHRVLYDSPSDLRWYASPTVFFGVQPK
ncbi:hypothetical protein EWB00_008069 [Schistosoma japonicum]|uniref:Uncharacterized protein n=1 Tax=Schistosoma japonicum TaxID=6182 RepID=A0A4Z2CRQ8_SCHJA|nr:hypothetical protein KSF78_0007114 [Schistosoma japonicum]TNN06917.1 hypothetical protein EWB00_008069 [Schistosoma japonicum]